MTIFWGEDVFESSTDHSGSIGVKIGDTRMPVSTYATARRIANAGSDGILTGDVSRTDVGILKRANVPIVSDPSGTRYWLEGPLPTPEKWLVPKPKSPTVKTGQYGASLKTHSF